MNLSVVKFHWCMYEDKNDEFSLEVLTQHSLTMNTKKTRSNSFLPFTQLQQQVICLNFLIVLELCFAAASVCRLSLSPNILWFAHPKYICLKISISFRYRAFNTWKIQNCLWEKKAFLLTMSSSSSASSHSSSLCSVLLPLAQITYWIDLIQLGDWNLFRWFILYTYVGIMKISARWNWGNYHLYLFLLIAFKLPNTTQTFLTALMSYTGSDHVVNFKINNVSPPLYAITSTHCRNFLKKACTVFSSLRPAGLISKFIWTYWYY